MTPRLLSASAFLVIAAGVALPGSPPLGDEQAAAFAMSVEDFQQLGPEDQQALIVEALEYRLQHGKNLSYEARRGLRNHVYEDGVLGDVQFQGITAVNRQWRLGDSYRLDTDIYGQNNETAPRQHLVTGYDADAGRSRSTHHTVGDERSYARIDVAHNAMTEHDRYAYWLDGRHTAFGEHLFRYLVDHQADITVQAPVEDRLVRVDVPWQPHFSDQPLGTRTFFLDPRKGLFPVRGDGKRERIRSNGKLSWRREEFFVEDSKLVGDVWMPTKLKEVITGSTGPGPNVANVYETEILRIEAGTVTPGDLVVPFPEGMEVVDAIEGVAYVADADGNPRSGTIEGLVGAESLTAIREPAKAAATDRQPTGSGPIRTWLILVNIGAVMVIGAIFLLRRRH